MTTASAKPKKILCVGTNFGSGYRFNLFAYDPVAKCQPVFFFPRCDDQWGELHDEGIPFGYGVAIESYPRKKPLFDQSGFPLNSGATA